MRALLLDVDNTLATYTSHTPMPGAVEWVRAMEAAGFQMIMAILDEDHIDYLKNKRADAPYWTTIGK